MKITHAPSRSLYDTLSAFAATVRLSAPEKAQLQRSFDKAHRYPPGHELVGAGRPLNAPLLLLAGWACQAVYLRDGRRQIIDFSLPGDLIGACSRPSARAKAPSLALTEVDVMPVPQAIAEAALPVMEEDYEQRLQIQIVRNGRLSATERLASLLCEFYSRLDARGAATEKRFHFPVTQEMLADALGLSVVHVNRTMQHLKRLNLVAFDGTSLTIRDFPALASLSGL